MAFKHCLCGLRMPQFLVLDGLPETLNLSIFGLFPGLEAVDTRDEMRPFTNFSLQHGINAFVVFFQLLNLKIRFFCVHFLEEVIVTVDKF